MSVSIIIAAYNRANQLSHVLPSYQDQEQIKEIIIVDDRSSDNTEEMIKAFIKSDPRIKYIKNTKRKGTCGTKNTGLKMATGEFIFYGEDDLELQPKFISTLLSHLKKNHADIICGRRIWPQPGETKLQSIQRANKKHNSPVFYDRLLTDCETKIKNDLDVYLLDASMLLKSKVAKKLLWDTKLFIDPIGWRSESDLQLDAAEKGYKMIFCPHVYAYHLPKYSYKINKIQYLKYDWWVVRNNYFFSLKHWRFMKKELKMNNLFLFNIQFILDRFMKRYINVFLFVVKNTFRKLM